MLVLWQDPDATFRDSIDLAREKMIAAERPTDRQNPADNQTSVKSDLDFYSSSDWVWLQITTEVS
jgi:hypothetical protein